MVASPFPNVADDLVGNREVQSSKLGAEIIDRHEEVHGGRTTGLVLELVRIVGLQYQHATGPQVRLRSGPIAAKKQDVAERRAASPGTE